MPQNIPQQSFAQYEQRRRLEYDREICNGN